MAKKKPLPDTIDESSLEGERLEQRYIPLETAQALGAKQNSKLHDIGKLAASIAKHGFGDAPKFDAKLENINGERGALVYGNGRTEALGWMHAQGWPRPRGVLEDKAGNWYIPIVFGVDSKDEAHALAYVITHNLLTVAGGSLQNFEQIQIFDEHKLLSMLADRPQLPIIGLDAEDIHELLNPKPNSRTSRNDKHDSAVCPECGHEFALAV